MNISNYYWYFSGALTPKFCDEVIQYANTQKEVMARTGGFGDKKLNKEEVKNLQRKRKSDLVWLNDTWIYKELHPYNTFFCIPPPDINYAIRSVKSQDWPSSFQE